MNRHAAGTFDGNGGIQVLLISHQLIEPWIDEMFVNTVYKDVNSNDVSSRHIFHIHINIQWFLQYMTHSATSLFGFGQSGHHCIEKIFTPFGHQSSSLCDHLLSSHFHLFSLIITDIIQTCLIACPFYNSLPPPVSLHLLFLDYSVESTSVLSPNFCTLEVMISLCFHVDYQQYLIFHNITLFSSGLITLLIQLCYNQIIGMMSHKSEHIYNSI